MTGATRLIVIIFSILESICDMITPAQLKIQKIIKTTRNKKKSENAIV